jgi:hypothetical protein
VRDSAECGRVADSFADGVIDRESDPDSHELTDPVTHADRAAFICAAERTIGHGRVGTRGGYATLPFV